MAGAPHELEEIFDEMTPPPPAGHYTLTLAEPGMAEFGDTPCFPKAKGVRAYQPLTP